MSLQLSQDHKQLFGTVKDLITEIENRGGVKITSNGASAMGTYSDDAFLYSLKSKTSANRNLANWRRAQYVLAQYTTHKAPYTEAELLKGWQIVTKGFDYQYLFLELEQEEPSTKTGKGRGKWTIYNYKGEQLTWDEVEKTMQQPPTNSHTAPVSQTLKTKDEPADRQRIYYGAPGTGKSYRLNQELTAWAPDKDNQFRTTFHPNYDYADFVGTYKPTLKKETKQLTYQFVPQIFTNAYVQAWQNYLNGEQAPVFLIIEEINRGNCAQIFGDLFQLLDRDERNFSSYSIRPDADLTAYLAGEFKKLKSAEYSDILSGERLLLPPNFYLYATMNTSDQSLFPMDSAFKRRWNWKYFPIQDEGKKYQIECGNKTYDWWQFLQTINQKITKLTNNEDKNLGYYFVKPDNGNTISAALFINKVLFYLENDVCKNYGREEIFGDGDDCRFTQFFTAEGNPQTETLQRFFEHLKLKANEPAQPDTQAPDSEPAQLNND